MLWGLRQLQEQEESPLHAKKREGKECYELSSETFSSTVPTGPIFRLQCLAGSVTQFIFSPTDTNDLTQSQLIFMEIN